MADTNQNPVELFDMYIAHVGINATDPADADRIAGEFSSLMGLEARDTPVSVFSDTLVEMMKQNGRGTKGHIGFHVNDMPAAEKWFSERGLEINEDSRALNPDGSTRLVYFKQEIGGFAIHLTSDK
ncbi:VOC family protein [Collinsella tanakaei]|uniref:VOC family protein n=1 Tax=Collinsella tanakaei TaxID=626935 RepID=UPI001F41C613|nr:VOC family protein [Collinsella tanakaei]MCF2622157.1 VOC family protein [Collinsella tanakaei]